MPRRCEICESLEKFTAIPAPERPVKRLLLDERIVALCDEHAAEARAAGAEELAHLRTHFQEPEGERSLIERRSPVERRVFPPRPEGRRHDQGRRSVDRRPT